MADSVLQLYIVFSAYRAAHRGWLYAGVHNVPCICCRLLTNRSDFSSLSQAICPRSHGTRLQPSKAEALHWLVCDAGLGLSYKVGPLP